MSIFGPFYQTPSTSLSSVLQHLCKLNLPTSCLTRNIPTRARHGAKTPTPLSCQRRDLAVAAADQHHVAHHRLEGRVRRRTRVPPCCACAGRVSWSGAGELVEGSHTAAASEKYWKKTLGWGEKMGVVWIWMLIQRLLLRFVPPEPSAPEPGWPWLPWPMTPFHRQSWRSTCGKSLNRRSFWGRTAGYGSKTFVSLHWEGYGDLLL